MANSAIVGKVKRLLAKEFIKDAEIVAAIDDKSIDPKKPSQLIGSSIFTWNQNPDTVQTVKTFITIQVKIPEAYYRQASEIYVRPQIIINIVSHEAHMRVDNVPKITENRNDYLSRLIDERINGRDDFGIGKVKLIINDEGAYLQHYLYRTMTFTCLDVNDSLCDSN